MLNGFFCCCYLWQSIHINTTKISHWRHTHTMVKTFYSPIWGEGVECQIYKIYYYIIGSEFSLVSPLTRPTIKFARSKCPAWSASKQIKKKAGCIKMYNVAMSVLTPNIICCQFTWRIRKYRGVLFVDELQKNVRSPKRFILGVCEFAWPNRSIKPAQCELLSS